MATLIHEKTAVTRSPKLPLKTYVFTWLGLLGLTLLTALVGFLDLGQFNIVISVAIAALQVSLIGGFFMHALYEKTLVRIIIAAAIIWFLIFETLTLGDYMTRGWVPSHFGNGAGFGYIYIYSRVKGRFSRLSVDNGWRLP